MQKNEITELRKQIDQIDSELTRLFLQRMDVCRKIGEYKKENGLPVLDAKREKQLLEEKTKNLPKQEGQTVEKLFKRIMEISREEQSKICNQNQGAVGFCGIKGAYGYFTAKELCTEPYAYDTFKSLALAIEKGEVTKGVLPIENTTAGSVLEVYDILAETSLFITGEIIVPISHCLLGVGEINDIKTVYSHP
ncbi:MAG: chorismate mutase, partial [Clostridia bacterium]|nr:chorismate mutase [Clostridia bacterium]